MDSEPSVEQTALGAFQKGDHDLVAEIVLREYGTELYSFVLAHFRGVTADADEVFSLFSEDFWRAVPEFKWRCSIRAWCYKLARSASSRYRRTRQKARRQVPLSQIGTLAEMLQLARTSTQAFMKSEVKDQIRALRDQLDQEDQDLLTLRIDRNLPWRDVAHAMASAEENPQDIDDEELKRQEVALRQRFTEVKKRLRKLAVAAGILSE